MVLKSPARDKRTFANTLKAARIGVRESQYEVGLMYAHGMGVAQDLEQAVYWIQKSAEKGLASAQYLLATRYASGAGVAQDEKQAVWWFLQAAQQGHAKALYKLGKSFAVAHLGVASSCIQEAAQMGLAEAQFAMGQELSSEQSADYEQALHWYAQAAEQDFAPAQCALGALYASGKGVEKDIEEARFWYRKAVRQNSPAAQVALEFLDAAGTGRTKGPGRGRRKPVVTERRQDAGRWDKVVESGDADARYHLGLMYELGIGVAQDAAQAQALYFLAAKQDDVRAHLALAKMLESQNEDSHVDWYRAAAQRENPEAQYVLGKKLSTGQGLEQDPFAGLVWYTRAADKGNPHALAELGRLCSGGLDSVAVTCYRQLADLGDAHGQFMLAQTFANGKGVEKNLHTAVYWWQQAALQGHAQAQGALGGACLEGRAIPKDFKKAFYWFQKAAEQNDAKAQWNLGSMYASGGEGVAQDLRQAFDWCQKSADLGFVPAQATLGVLYMLIKDPAQALAWWHKAADQGDAEAQYNLAVAISTGNGVQKDYTQAFHWFYEAATRGLVNAQSRLGLLYVTGEGVAIDAIEAHKWFLVAASAGDAAARENLLRSEALLGPMQIAEATRRAKLHMHQSLGAT